MASTRLRHQAASSASWVFIAGAGCSAAARSKCVAASSSSAAERGPTSHELYPSPISTSARIWLAPTSSGAALTTLADSALSPSSFHHSGLATSAHASHIRAHRVALPGLEVPLRGLHEVPRVIERCTEAVVRLGLAGPQGNGLAVGPGCSAPIKLRGVPRAISQQLLVRVARLRGAPGCVLRGLAIPLLHHPSILRALPMPLHLL
eukprot:scaffold11403_cov64-Phaeocystis_antarctica.AAC.1